jgi:hypothetical protein
MKYMTNFINLCYHEDDFGVDAERHFFASSHGKEACDGIVGTIERLSRKARLQNPYQEQIMAQRNYDAQREVQESLNTFGYSKSTLCGSCLKNQDYCNFQI